MEHRLELAAKALAFERVATGGLAAIAPGRAIGAITTPGSDTEVARIGEGIGLSEDQSYELFGHLVDEGLVYPGRTYRAGGAMRGSISRIVGREENMTLIGDDVRLTSKGRAEIQ
jgi:hypothetical protein